jgi:hypothetical protein
MVEIKRDTLSISLIEYVRNLLRNNLVHPSDSADNWIFKDNPADGITADNLPRVLISDGGQDIELKGMSRVLKVPKDLTVSIEVYTLDTYTRDEIADDIRRILTTEGMEDADGDTLKTMQLYLHSLSSESSDMYSDYPKPFRVKDMNCVFRYKGG